MIVANMLETGMDNPIRTEEQAGVMQAITYSQYGSPDVLRLQQIDKPVVGGDDVLVRVHAASVCKGDVHLISGKPYLIRLIGIGVLRPKHGIAGQDVAGRVEAIGKNVTDLQPGDDVFGQVPLGGGFAEYACAPADKFAPKPSNLSFEQAAAVPDSGLTALQGLRDVGNLQSGQSVLINGASGGVGTFAVQIAKALGARVTAVCSTRHVDKVRAIGADDVIDYTKDDFAECGRRYDLMLDLVGNRALSDCKRILKPEGVFVSSAGAPGENWIGPVVWQLKVLLTGIFSSQKMTPFLVKPGREDLLILKTLIEAGQVTPVIEQQFALNEAAEAVRHVATGHAQGKTVISI